MSPFEILAEEIGAVAGRIERESGLRIEALIADMRRLDAERELRLTNLVRQVEDRLAAVKDGIDGRNGMDGERGTDGLPGEPGLNGVDGKDGAVGVDGKDGADGRDGATVDDVIAAMLPVDDGRVSPLRTAVADYIQAFPPKDGRDGADGKNGDRGPEGAPADPAVVAQAVRDCVAALGLRNGVDADPEAIRLMVDAAVAKLPPAERGAPGKDGKFPVALPWVERVYYEGEVATLDGGTFQAIHDTGRAPGHEDWACLASAGRDGVDGRSMVIRGTYADGTDYAALDIVALNGAGFVARRDDPGPCPGDGWQMFAAQGKRGNAGERGIIGPKGDRGDPGPAIVAADVDANGLVIIRNVDGSEVSIDLYPVLEKLGR